MKRLMKYYREKKGITLVLIALMLAVLLFFLGMAVDISYMYHVKNQLQVAADAAALAGITQLSGGTDDSTADLIQEDARREAWKFACKNRVANAPVYLVTTGADCDNLPANTDLNNTNDPNGDIVVGHWENTPFSCTAPLRTGVVNPVKFCPANHTTGSSINAIQTFPRKTEGSPNGSARVFVGQVFRVIGINWGYMSAVAEAIASKEPVASAAMTMCFPGCTNPDTGLPCISPTVCEFSPRLMHTGPCTPAEVASGTCGQTHFAWTSFRVIPTSPGFDLNDLICNEKLSDNVCGKTIWTILGGPTDTLRNLESAMYDPSYDAKNKEIDSLGRVNWWITVPIIGDEVTTFCPPGTSGWSESTVPVGYYARVRLLAVCAPGTAGCRGYSSPTSLCTSLGLTGSGGIAVNGLSCTGCTEFAADSPPVLVK